MKSTAAACLAPVLLAVMLVSGCRPRMDIARDTRLQGVHRVSEFVVSPGVRVTVAADLTIDATGTVQIFGTLAAEPGSGADIRLRSRNGDIEIHGSVTTADGADGGDRSGTGILIAANGADGGDIVLTSIAGTVLVRGELIAGNGGTGGSVSVSGPGGLQFASSGLGGNGGEVLVSAGKGIDIGLGGARVDAGRGGASGDASAEIVRANPPVEHEVPTDEVQPPPPLSGTTTARTLAGGRGGRVVLATSQARSRIYTQLRFEAGNGGDSGRASASGGQVANANAGPGGKGGDVEMTAPANGTILTLTFPDPGDGGLAGVPAAPAHAFASAEVSALAEVGAGGVPGIWIENGTRFSSGDGGANGNADARAAGGSKFDPGQMTLNSTPAPFHLAKVP